jgi:hypothetical protein
VSGDREIRFQCVTPAGYPATYADVRYITCGGRSISGHNQFVFDKKFGEDAGYDDEKIEPPADPRIDLRRRFNRVLFHVGSNS